jgi:hypothetical protein
LGTALAGPLLLGALVSVPNSSGPRSPPNPNGRNGGPEHQAGVDAAEAELGELGLNPVREEHVPTPGGAKGRRFVDVAGQDADGNTVVRIQVGRQNQNGQPPKRERDAMRDITNAQPDIPVWYHPDGRH